MGIQINQEMRNILEGYRLPKYAEIPNVGLYLNQVAKYINEYMEPFDDMNITESMISNYVKKHLVKNPVKKQYEREQIAYLIFIAVAKSVLSMDNIKLLMDLQMKNYDSQRAYDYFACEFENILQYIFGIKDVLEVIGEEQNETFPRKTEREPYRMRLPDILQSEGRLSYFDV